MSGLDQNHPAGKEKRLLYFKWQKCENMAITMMFSSRLTGYKNVYIVMNTNSVHTANGTLLSRNEKSLKQDDEQKRLRLLIGFLRQLAAACHSHLLSLARRY